MVLLEVATEGAAEVIQVAVGSGVVVEEADPVEADSIAMEAVEEKVEEAEAVEAGSVAEISTGEATPTAETTLVVEVVAVEVAEAAGLMIGIAPGPPTLACQDTRE